MYNFLQINVLPQLMEPTFADRGCHLNVALNTVSYVNSPQCVICSDVLSNSAMLPAKLAVILIILSV
jgi:hypothetical protein